MPRYLLSRSVEFVVVVWGVLTVVFVVLRLSGDPTILMLPVGATAEEAELFRHALGFDRPLYVQYWEFIKRAVTGDFSESLRYRQPALPVVLERMPATIELAATALGIAIVLGAATGALAALRRGTMWELVSMGLALVGQAAPVFWVATMLILVFAVQLEWLPAAGRGDVKHLILPAASLALYSTASIARLFRSSLLETLGEDYVRTARAKGQAGSLVLIRHVIPNALLPVVTMIGLQAGMLFGGSIITETIFGWPGMGRLTVQAIYNADFPVVQAAACTMAVVVAGMNLVVDLLYACIDPRIRLTR